MQSPSAFPINIYPAFFAFNSALPCQLIRASSTCSLWYKGHQELHFTGESFSGRTFQSMPRPQGALLLQHEVRIGQFLASVRAELALTLHNWLKSVCIYISASPLSDGDYVTEPEFQIHPFPTFSLFEKHQLQPTSLFIIYSLLSLRDAFWMMLAWVNLLQPGGCKPYQAC